MSIREHQPAPPIAPLRLERWECCGQPPGSVRDPAQLQSIRADWFPAHAPGTVASALRNLGQWDFDRPADLDGQDWWYRTTFQASAGVEQPCTLCLDGLATLAEVWLNGQLLLTTENMFRGYRVEISSFLQARNELVLGFRSLTEDLKRKRPRPRWKTNLVKQQQLRWLRTSLQGRIPGWSPPVPPVGPWREVRLETQPVKLANVHLVSQMEGSDGVVTFSACVESALPLQQIRLRVGTEEAVVVMVTDANGSHLRGELRIPTPPLWWPHTHGAQPLLPCELLLESDHQSHSIPLGSLGFRALEVEGDPGFGIQINGVPIYCRGACWTTADIFTLSGTEETLRHDLQLAVDAGVNMLRIGGTMTYECETFYRLCDELGILVWQDFMFANMDYPTEDEGVAHNIQAEAHEQLQRLAAHPCVVAYCGNSEVEQQAAMLGMPRELWRNRWFGEQLPGLCQEHHPGTAYVPSTPSGGALPFHLKSGVAHYYGVGAYLRLPSELRSAGVRFSPECLGFANIPEPATVEKITHGALPVIHHPQWKQRVPRDTGPGWDFEDVRDFYLRHMFDVDPVALRSFDMPRYLQLSRVVSGEMMAQTFAEWRSTHSVNRGGLVWFFKDLWPAAGWGVIDSAGIPKAAYYYLRRSWQSRQLTLTDEGLEGLHLQVLNEQPQMLLGTVEVVLLKEPAVVVARREVPVELAPRSEQMLSADAILEAFYDVNYAYRFGPPHHDVVIATLYDADRRVLSEGFHFVRRREPVLQTALALEANAQRVSDTKYEVTLRSDRFLHSVRLAANGFLPDDNYFHLPPDRTKTVTFTALPNGGGSFQPSLEALNLRDMQFISVTEAGN